MTAVDKPGTLYDSETASPPKFEQNVLLTAKGGGIIATGRFFTYGSRFVLAFMLARLLGAEQYGLYSLALTTGAILGSVATFGLDSALVRYVAILNSRRDERGLWGALQIGVGFSTVLSSLFTVGLYALAYPIATQVFHEPQLTPLLQATSMMVPFLTLSDVLAGATRGFKKMQYSVIAQDFAQLLVRLILTGAFAIIGLSPLTAIVIFTIADVVSSVFLVYFLNKEFRLRRPLRDARRDTREIVGFSLPLWISGLLSTFRNNIETMLLGALNTVTGVGIFTVAGNINLVGHMLFNAISLSSKPIIAELHGNGEIGQMNRLYRTTSRWAFTIYLPAFIITVLFPVPLLSIFGESFVDGAGALRVLAVAELVNVLTGNAGTVIDMTGYTKLKLANSIIQIILSMGVNVLLIPRWGLMGAAVGSLLGVSMVNMLRMAEVRYLFHTWPYDRSFTKPVLAAFLSIAVVLVVGSFLPPSDGLIDMIVRSAVVMALYFGLVLLLGLPPEETAVVGRTRQWANKRLTRFRRT